MFTSIDSILTQTGLPVWVLSAILVWSLVWKGFALWNSARKNHFVWFIAFLVLQTIGILEILYLFVFSKIKFSKNSGKPRKK